MAALTLPPRRAALLTLTAATLILIGAFALRTHLIGAQSFWNDEGNTYVQSLRTLPEIAFHAGRDIHPPGYYTAIAVWRVLTGESETAYRLLSAFASLLTIAAVYAVGRRLGGHSVGLIAAALLSANTFSIYYAQEARMYALLGLWAALSLLTLLRLADRPTPRRAAAHGIITAAGLWTGYAYPFVMLAQGVWIVLVLVSQWPQRRTALRLLLAYTGANLLAFALFAPWIPTAITQITTWPNTGEPIAFGVALATILHWLTYGITAGAEPLAIPLIVIAFGLVRTSIRRVLPVLLVIVPLSVFLLMELFREANLKHLLPAAAGLSLAVALGLDGLTRLGSGRRRWLTRTAALTAGAWIALVLIEGLPPLYTDPAYRRDDYRAIAAIIAAMITESADPTTAIILNAPNQREVFGYYYRGAAPVYGLPEGLGGDDDATRAALDRISATYDRAFVVYWGAAERDPNAIVENTLSQAAFEGADTWFGDVRLVQYAFPQPPTITRTRGDTFGEIIRLDAYALNAERVRPGDAVQVTFTWRALAPLTERYVVFVQLLDEAGRLVAQRDSEPGGGAALTSTWLPDTPIADNHALFIPADLPLGTYTLIAGLYPLDDAAARLVLDDGTDALTLASITVE